MGRKNAHWKVSKAGELVAIPEYLSMTKLKKVLTKNRKKHSVIISTHTVVHTCIYVSVIKDGSDIPMIICNSKQACQSVQRQPTCIYDAYYYYILDEIVRH